MLCSIRTEMVGKKNSKKTEYLRDMGGKEIAENQLDVAEIGLRRWMCGVTKLDMIRNERPSAQMDNESWAGG